MTAVPLTRIVAVGAALCMAFGGATAATASEASDRVGDFRPKAAKVRIDKAPGQVRWAEVTADTRVIVVDKAGNRTRTDVDDLVRGARVVGKRVVEGKLSRITLQERAATGAVDCSFDSSTDDDSVSEDDSFECSHDYDDGVVDTDTDCSYDSSRDGEANDWSMDASWDCSFSEDSDRDDDGALDWDCSYSASAGGYQDADGGDADADLDFDCSWSGASTDSALWDCKFLPGVLGFRCVSAQLSQEFTYTINIDEMAIEGGMDFQRDVVAEETTGDDGVGCSGSAADGYDCSVDGEVGTGDCTVDWSFDRSRATREGDVSGSLSYSCSWDA